VVSFAAVGQRKRKYLINMILSNDILGEQRVVRSQNLEIIRQPEEKLLRDCCKGNSKKKRKFSHGPGGQSSQVAEGLSDAVRTERLNDRPCERRNMTISGGKRSCRRQRRHLIVFRARFLKDLRCFKNDSSEAAHEGSYQERVKVKQSLSKRTLTERKNYVESGRIGLLFLPRAFE